MQEFEGIDASLIFLYRLSPEPGKGGFTLFTAPYLIEIIATQPSGTGPKAVCFSVHCVKKKYIYY